MIKCVLLNLCFLISLQWHAGVAFNFQYNGGDYFFGKDYKNWHDAKNFCKGYWGQGNGDLATVDDINENNYLAEIIKNQGRYDTYIGLNDIVRERQWTWEDGCPLAFTRWHNGEPNNQGDEDCVHFWGNTGGTWNDLACGSRLAYICERKRTNVRCGKPATLSFNGNEYYHGTSDATWQEARDFCRGYWGAGNGDLVTVNDVNENTYLFELIKNNGKKNTWIGATDVNLEGNFIWTDNCPVQYSRWNTGEPNNLDVENCAHFWGDAGGAWNDLACSSKQWFICERKKTNVNCGDPRVFKWNEGEYLYSKTGSTWQEARDFCRGFWGAGNGDLVTVNDITENNYLFEVVKNNGKQNTWIGANDINLEGNFIGIDNCPVKFTRWNTGEPNNLGKEDCAHFWGDAGGAWNDLDCGARLWHICERKISNETCGDPRVFKWNEGEYFYGKTGSTWQEARDFCRNYWGAGNGDLVIVNDMNENNYLFEIVKNNGKQNTYISGNDIAQEGRWIFEEKCPVEFTRWNTGEPNNLGKEDCAHFWGDAGGTWNDIACASKFWFLCERKRIDLKCGKVRPILPMGINFHVIGFLQSENYPQYFIDAKLDRSAWIEIGRREAFRIVKGLAGGRTVSFESTRQPGNFLRHENALLWLHPQSQTELFKNDASFFMEENDNGFFHLRSVNYPNHFVRHQNYGLKLHKDDGSASFQKDKSFQLALLANKEGSSEYRPPLLPNEMKFGGRFELQSVTANNILQERTDKTLWFGAGSEGLQLRVVKGLSGVNTISFESNKYRGWYLRHQNSLIKLNQLEDTELFKQESSFYIEELGNGFFRFQSVNYPLQYIRIDGNQLKISPIEDSEVMYLNSCFKITRYIFEIEIVHTVVCLDNNRTFSPGETWQNNEECSVKTCSKSGIDFISMCKYENKCYKVGFKWSVESECQQLECLNNGEIGIVQGCKIGNTCLKLGDKRATCEYNDRKATDCECWSPQGDRGLGMLLITVKE